VLTKPFELHNLQAYVEPNCSMSANKALGMTRRNAPGVHPQRGRTTRNKWLTVGWEIPLSEQVDKTTDRHSQLFLGSRVKVKVKQFNYRPGQALRIPGIWGSQISRHLALEGGRVVSPTHRPPLPPGNIPSTHFC